MPTQTMCLKALKMCLGVFPSPVYNHPSELPQVWKKNWGNHHSIYLPWCCYLFFSWRWCFITIFTAPGSSSPWLSPQTFKALTIIWPLLHWSLSSPWILMSPAPWPPLLQSALTFREKLPLWCWCYSHQNFPDSLGKWCVFWALPWNIIYWYALWPHII